MTITVWYVDGDVSGSGDGTSWSTAIKTIQGAIDVGSENDQIWVKQGTYVLSSEISLSKTLDLYGAFTGSETERSQRNVQLNKTTISGENSVRCVSITANGVLDGFTITNGTAEFGGAILNFANANSTLSNCNIVANSATSGGAISNNGNLTIINCDLSMNTAQSIAGSVHNLGTMRIEDSDVF